MTARDFVEQVIERLQDSVESDPDADVESVVYNDSALSAAARLHPEWKELAVAEVQRVNVGASFLSAIGRSLTAHALCSNGDSNYTTTLKVGTRIRLQDVYVIQEHAEGGGQGEVYRAFSETLQCSAALKMLDVDPTHGKVDGAMIAAQLNHPGVSSVLGSGETDDGIPVYIMRHIDGKDLSEQIRNANAPALSSDQRREYIRGLLHSFVSVCDTMDYVHERGAIHCDLKSKNVRAGKHGEVVVLDWDSAVSMHSRFRAPRDFVGKHTLAYAAPELRHGKSTSPSARVDIYSLGVILYEILIGNTPIGEQDNNLARLQDVSPPLESIVRMAIAEDPEKRYTTAGELGRDVQAWLEKRPVSVHRYPHWSWLINALRRPSTAAKVALGLSVALLVGLLLALVVQWRQARTLGQAEKDALRLAAQSTAAVVGEDVRERWSFLRSLASEISASPNLLNELQMPAQGEGALLGSELQKWLAGKTVLREGRVPEAQSWFVLDRYGRQIAKATKVVDELHHTLGGDFSTRPYFKDANDEMIDRLYVSGVYKSSSTDQLRIAFCCPIYSGNAEMPEGVVAMSADLHGDINLAPQWLPNYTTVILLHTLPADGEIASAPNTGTFLVHPEYQRQAQRGDELTPVYEAANYLPRYETIARRRLRQRRGNAQFAPLDNYEELYRDPVDDTVYRFAFEPVVLEIDGSWHSTGLIVKIQR